MFKFEKMLRSFLSEEGLSKEAKLAAAKEEYERKIKEIEDEDVAPVPARKSRSLHNKLTKYSDIEVRHNCHGGHAAGHC